MTKAAELPAFKFPVIAWAPDPATGDPGDPGTRSFVQPRDVVTTYFPDSDLRLGWTFVDLEGRCWAAVSSKVTGRAGGWPARLLPRWLYDTGYALALEFEERSPVSFDAVKSRLHLAVTADPQILGYARERRAQLHAARDLRDLIKSDDELALERLEDNAWWWQWLFAQGRCPRLMFASVGAGIVFAATFLLGTSAVVPFPIWLASVMAVAWLSISAIVRRLHDLRMTGWWMLLWAPPTMISAAIHDHVADETIRGVSGHGWQLLTLAVLGLLTAWPGTRGPNRYGHGPRPPVNT